MCSDICVCAGVYFDLPLSLCGDVEGSRESVFIERCLKEIIDQTKQSSEDMRYVNWTLH